VPLISIITVNYNDSLGLERTIKSVQEQTVTDYEHIIIDGGSTDGSKEVIERYKNSFSHWVSEPDNGIYSAMNKGIKASKGVYLLFLNSGDSLYTNEVLQKVSRQLVGDYSIYYGDIIRIYSEHKALRKSYPKVLNFGFFVESALAHQSVFIKKELFDSYFYYNESFKILSDWEFLIYLICNRNIPYKHLDMIISNYDMNGVSSQMEGRIIMKQERHITYKKHFPLFMEDYKNLIDEQEPEHIIFSNKIITLRTNKWIKPVFIAGTNCLYAFIKLKRKLVN